MRKPPVFLLERKAQSQKLTINELTGFDEFIDWDKWGQPGNGNPAAARMGNQLLYRTVSYVRRAVNIRANALASLPWEVTTTGDEPVWTSGEKPPDKLYHLRNFPQMLKRIGQGTVMDGAAYHLKVQKQGRLLPPQWMVSTTVKPKWSPSQGIYAYERTVQDANGKRRTITYAAEDVSGIFATDLYTEIGPASGDAEACRVHADVLNALGGFASQFLSSGAVKATLLGVSGSIPPDKKEELEQWWKRFIAGWRNAGNSKVVNADAIAPVVIGEGLKELSNVELSLEQRKGIAHAFEIPFALLDSQTSTDANVAGDHASLLNFTVIPHAIDIEPQIQSDFFEDMDLEFHWRPERHELMQKSEVQKANSLVPLVNSGILEIDEARETMGYDPLGGAAAEEADKEAELRTWRRYLKKHGLDARPFECKHIEAWEQSIILDRLAETEDIDESLRLP